MSTQYRHINEKWSTMQINRMIPTIGYAYGHASRDKKASEGPKCIQKRTRNQQSLNWKTIIEHPTAQHQKDAALSDVKVYCGQLAQAITQCGKESAPFLVIGGDHSSAIGTWHGATALSQKSLGLIWIDAHLDSHTPESSISKNIHGMPLAILLGYGDEKLTALKHSKPVLQPEHLTIVGVTDYEPAESNLITSLKVSTHPLHTLPDHDPYTVIMQAVQQMEQQERAFGISLDLDAFDPKIAPAITTEAPDGLNVEGTLRALKKAAQSKYFLGLEIAEFTPHKDIDRLTENLIINIINTTFGLNLS
jgi:arginase